MTRRIAGKSITPGAKTLPKHYPPRARQTASIQGTVVPGTGPGGAACPGPVYRPIGITEPCTPASRRSAGATRFDPTRPDRGAVRARRRVVPFRRRPRGRTAREPSAPTGRAVTAAHGAGSAKRPPWRAAGCRRGWAVGNDRDQRRPPGGNSRLNPRPGSLPTIRRGPGPGATGGLPAWWSGRTGSLRPPCSAGDVRAPFVGPGLVASGHEPGCRRCAGPLAGQWGLRRPPPSV
jgi:hypothetical protein